MPTYLAKNGKTYGPYLPQEVEQMKLNGEFFEYEWLWDGTTPDWTRVPPPAPPPPPPRAPGAKVSTDKTNTNLRMPAPGASAPAQAAAPAPSASDEKTVVSAPAQSQVPVAQPATAPASAIHFPPRPEVSSPSPARQQPAAAAQPTLQGKKDVRKSNKEFQVICHDFHRLLSGTATEVTSEGCRLVCAEKGVAPHLVPNSKVWMDLLDEKTDQSVTIKVTLGELKKEGDRWIYNVQWENNPLV